MTIRQFGAGVSLVALSMAMASAAYAQETTGGVRGLVSDATGAPVANATVTITHVPTGTRATSVTGSDGFYSARGLRVGGPYRVEATAAGQPTTTANVAAIGVGEPAGVNLRLGPAADASVEELVIMASAGQPTQGPSTRYGASDIASLPSISRDFKDIARLDPFATIDPTNQDALSFAGANTRFNQLTVDGVRQNDDFGLNNNGYPTQRSPVSLDAVEAIQVSVAPYSVVNNGFLGGSINVVTRSGTNDFHGSAYYEKTGRDLQGTTIRGAPVGAEFSEKTYGATLGGPIIQDKLFFFGAYEKFEGSFGLDEGPFDLGRSVQIPRITSTAVETFRNETRRVYSYDPGTFVTSTPGVQDEKIRARVDWNITQDHRLTGSYQRTLGNAFNGSTSSTFASGNSVTQPAIGFESRQYNKNERLDSYTAQLNSDWTSSFSTELRFNSKETDTTQIPLNGLSVGQIQVDVADLPGVAAGAGTPRMQFGADLNRHDNYLNTKVNTYEALARYSVGAHELIAGARIETDDIYNVFVANSIGSYTFSSYANFLNRTASGFTATGAVDPNGGTVPARLGTARDGVAAFGFTLFSLYAEDNWQVLDNLSVAFGARYERYKTSDVPVLNNAFVSRNGFTNGKTIDGESVFLPRVSFNYEPIQGLSVTGGIGKFSSTGLNVWLSNPFANDGVRQTNAVCTGPIVNVDLTKAPANCTFTPGNGDTNALDPDFAIPTVWKGNLSLGYDFDLGQWGLGDRWRVQGDALHTINEDALLWRDARARVIGVAPDGRPVYGPTTTGTIGANRTDMLLTNTSKGHSTSLAGMVAKNWNDGLLEGLSFTGSYTYTKATDANPMTSSIATSSFTRFASTDHQNPRAFTSDYEVRHKFAVQLSWARRLFGDNETVVSMFAQHRSGLPFSYTFANSSTNARDTDFGNWVTTYSGRQASSNALFYVPAAAGGSVTATSDPKVTYAAGFDVAAFDSLLKSSGLIDYAGSIVPRNAFRGPSVTTIDLHFSQELPAFFPGGAKLLGFIDIENFGNLLNDKWGVLEQYDFYRGVPVADVRCGATTATSCAGATQYVYQSLVTQTGTNNQVRQPFLVNNASLWQIKVGVKYRF
jgi:outer membrane receptor for ferrienterochelin and colicin